MPAVADGACHGQCTGHRVHLNICAECDRACARVQRSTADEREVVVPILRVTSERDSCAVKRPSTDRECARHRTQSRDVSQFERAGSERHAVGVQVGAAEDQLRGGAVLGDQPDIGTEGGTDGDQSRAGAIIGDGSLVVDRSRGKRDGVAGIGLQHQIFTGSAAGDAARDRKRGRGASGRACNRQAAGIRNDDGSRDRIAFGGDQLVDLSPASAIPNPRYSGFPPCPMSC